MPLEKLIAIVLRAKPAAILFEAANPRHEHEWIVWRDTKIPQDKILVPGLIDTCTNYLEHPELIAQRLQRYIEIVGADRVIAGTDCGFGTFRRLRQARPGGFLAQAGRIARRSRFSCPPCLTKRV